MKNEQHTSIPERLKCCAQNIFRQPSGDDDLHDDTRVIFVLVLSGLFGFCVGLFGHTTWQVVVQTSQVVAGIVKYPSYNPNYIGQTAIWTILHQICAIFLHLGISERTLSFIFSGILGMLSFQALAMCVFALGQNTFLALAASFFIHLTGAVNFGVIYPIWLMGQPHTYGIVGQAWMLLVIALIGAGQSMLGGFLLGLAPAVHPALGAFLWMIVFCSLLLDVHDLRDWLCKLGKPFAAGFAITLVSFLFQMFVTYDVPRIPSDLAARYLATFMELWDAHRQAINLRHEGVYLVLASFGLSGAWLWFFKSDLSKSVLFLLRVFFAAAVIGIGLSLTSFLPPGIIPASVNIAMPARFLNLNILGFMALLIGLLGRYNTHGGMQSLLALLVAVLVIPDAAKNVVYGQTFRAWNVMVLVASVTMLVKLFLFLRSKYGVSKPYGLYLAKGMTCLGLIAAIIMVGVETYNGWRYNQYSRYEWLTNDLRDRTNDPLFARAYKGKGMLLTCADLYLIQLRTRRPVLIEGGALDNLPYAPAAGPEMEKILREVYGIDFFNPPDEAKRRAMIPVYYTKPIWEARSPAEWYALRERFGVTDVMAYADWKLALPEIARNERLVLYQISDYLRR
jgi:uncharacterized membrane protein